MMNTDQILQPSMWRHWEVLLPSLSEVLQVGLSLVQSSGRFVIPPQKHGDVWRFGTRFLWDTFRLQEGALSSSETHTAAWIDCLESADFYYELKDPLGLKVFMLPLAQQSETGLQQNTIQSRKESCFLAVGPVIPPPPWQREDYQNMLNALNLPLDLLEDLANVKVIEEQHLRSVMQLLHVIQRDFLTLVDHSSTTQSSEKTQEDERIQQPQEGGGAAQQEGEAFKQLARSLRTQINLDDFLLHVMDLMVGISRAQRGSIMLYHAQKAQLELRAAKGFVLQKTRPLVRSLEEGLAGYALKRKHTLLLDRTRHRPLIKRLGHLPDLHQSLILPLLTKEGDPLGVINLSTMEKGKSLAQHQEILEQLSRLTALFLSQFNHQSG